MEPIDEQNVGSTTDEQTVIQIGITITRENVIYSGLCEGEKENGAGEKKMLAVVDFFLLFSLIPTFCQPQEIFFHWFLLLKL